MVSGAEKKKRRAAAAASATSSADPLQPGITPMLATSPSSSSTSMPQATTPYSPNSAVGVILSHLPAPFDKYKDRIDPKVLAELYIEVGAVYKGLDKAKHERSWREGYIVGLDLGKIEGRKEGAAQLRREVRAEVQDDLRRERMHRRCEASVQVDSVPVPISPLGGSQQPTTDTRPLNWADDVDKVLSTQPAPAIPVVSRSRDLSALRPAHNSKPFGSLQQRSRRARHGSATIRGQASRPSRADIGSWRSTSNRLPFIHSYRGHHTYRFPRTNRSLPGRSLLTSESTLDWEGDPRLAELGRVLTSLGWVRSS